MNEVIVLLIAVATQLAGFSLLVHSMMQRRRNRNVHGIIHIPIALFALGCAVVVFALQSGSTGITIAGVSNLLLGGAFTGFLGTDRKFRLFREFTDGAVSGTHADTLPASSHPFPLNDCWHSSRIPERLARTIKECTIETDEELRCRTWDIHCEALFGCSQDFALNTALPELIYGVEPLVSENIIRQASYSGAAKTIMLPTINGLPSRTLQLEVVPHGARLFIHAKDISDSIAEEPRQNHTQSREFNVSNHASALTYIASRENGLQVTFISSDIKDIFGNGSNGKHIARDIIERRIHPDDKNAVLNTFQDSLNASTPFAIDYRLVGEDNAIRWYHEEAVPVAGAGGEMHGVIVNLNGRLAAEETLKNTADHALEVLSNGVKTGLVFLKGDSIRYANESFARLQGTGQNSLRSTPIQDIVRPQDREELTSWLEHVRDGSATELRHEFGLDGDQGTLVEMELSTVELFGQEFTLGTIRDITQDVKMEQELTSLATFPDLNPNPIIEISPDGQISYLNQAALETFPSLPLLNTDHPVIDTVTNNLEEFRANDKQTAYREATVGDRIYGELLSKVPATDIIRIYLNDITERCEFEENLAAAKQLAEKANRLKSEFLANMSHEIRTPLNIILGYTDLVKETVSDRLEEKCDKYFSYIHNAGGQLTQTIDKIIDISRFHIQDFPIAPQVIPLSHMLSESVAGLQVLAKMGGLTLTLEMEDSECLIFADPYAINESLTNVIGNAIKYTLSGSVDVSLISSEEGEVCVRVSDTGIGISEEFLPYLFDEFSQEEGGYGRPFEGTGLGLALTKKFIDACGGTISVDSVKGEGTTFLMTFPAYSGTASITKETDNAMNETNEPAPVAQPDEQKNILVVEDDSLTQDFMKILLGKKYNKFFAMSASEANAVLEVNHINIILMDLSIKGNEDGITLTKAIRNHPEWKNIPIIALTAHAFARDRENAIAAGCNAFFSKPFNRSELLAAIDKLAIP